MSVLPLFVVVSPDKYRSTFNNEWSDSPLATTRYTSCTIYADAHTNEKHHLALNMRSTSCYVALRHHGVAYLAEPEVHNTITSNTASGNFVCLILYCS
jgi:hypothetical protein